jgi:stage V sporulation protein B
MKIFQDVMGIKGYEDSVIRSLTGIYSSKYRLLCSVPIAISTAIATSMIPSIVMSFTNKNTESVKQKIAESVKFNMMIAFPCAIGLAVLGQSIIRMLFPESDYVLGGRFMIAGSTSIIFFSLSNVTSGALQSINKMRLPVIHSAISLLLHITILLGLLKFTNLGGYALIFGNVTFPILVFIMNFASLKKYIGYKQELLKTIFTAFSASLWMALAIAAVYLLLNLVTKSAAILSISSLIAAVFIYFIVYIKLKGVTKEELYDFPMGRRLHLIAAKMRLMK